MSCSEKYINRVREAVVREKFSSYKHLGSLGGVAEVKRRVLGRSGSMCEGIEVAKRWACPGN